MPRSSGQDYPLRLEVALLWFFGAATLAGVFLWGPPAANAAQYRIRSITIGRATQYFRSDRSVSAPRQFTQGMSLWGYDLLDDRTGSLNAHVSFRFHTDFSLSSAERNDPYLAHQWNDLVLDLAYLDWKPFEAMRLRFGRQWSMSSLGVRDFDGVAFRWRPRLEASTRARFEAYAGRDIQTAYGRFDSAQFDVQGLPPDDRLESDKLDGTHFVTGAGAGMSWARQASFDLSWRRRFSTGVDSPTVADAGSDGTSTNETVVGSERFGAAASASFMRRLVASTHGAFHSQLQDVDRAGLQLSWMVPDPMGVATAGVDHRHPWFDSSSIFNLFGARPYQSAFLTYQQPVDSLRTDVELRGWGRLYHGDDEATASGVDAQDERTAGAAISHTSRLKVGRHPMNWRSLLSYQTSLDRGSDQLLADVRLRMPVWQRDLFLSVRGLALAALTDHRRFDDGYATTGVVGLDVPISTLGTLSAAVETTTGSVYPTNTSVYATFALEHWP
ncbi:MAG: porin [Persicimonas sp.]